MNAIPDTAMAEATDTLPPGVILFQGEAHRRDQKGRLVPDDMVKPQHKLEDETVRRVFGYAEALSAQIRRFREHTLQDIAGFLALLDQEYGDHRGGQKGNVTLTTFDGLLKVQLQVADIFTFGPELQTAKSLFDECMTEWAEGSRPEIRAVLTRAFDSDKEGKVNRTDLFSLLRLAIEDPRWKRAMDAVRDSMKPVGSKEYVRFYRRAKVTAKWEAVSIDMATA